MGSEGPKQWRKRQPPPPRTLDVRKYTESRSSDLNSLVSAVSNRLNGDFRSRRHKRRRTTAFHSTGRRHKRHGHGDDQKRQEEREEAKLPRRVRRRLELKSNPDSGFSVSSDGTRRLRTHVWYAKRFTMEKLWGFYLPLGLHGRGRGSRALLKWYKQGVVVHDASYYNPVQLEGPEDSLLSILSKLLVPSPTASDELVLSGQVHGSAMLYDAAQDGSKAICPVTYFWRPFHHHEDKGAAADDSVNTSHLRRVWIWMHPSAFAQGFDCLKLACQAKMDQTAALVSCVSLDGQLGKLEVMGSRAFQLLQKILHLCNTNIVPAGNNLESGSMEEDKNGCGNEQNILKMDETLSSSAVASLFVADPRFLVAKRSSADPETGSVSNLCGLQDDEKKDYSAGNLHMKDDELSLLRSNYEVDSSCSNCKDLWDVTEGIHPPIREHMLCLERHKRSLDLFCLKDMISTNSMSTQTQFSTLCPILLLRNTDKTGLLSGWSIILPLNWVKAFWMPLVSGGAHAIGLREKHWIAGDVGLPYFPSDFPDCDSYSCFMAREAVEVEKKMELRPPDTRPLKVPIPPPWTSVSFGFHKGAKLVNGVDTYIIVNREDQSTDLDSEISDVLPTETNGSGCSIFVARTSGMLTSFLKEISGGHLLLFPKGPDRKSFSHLMKDEAKLNQASKPATLKYDGRRLCYLRVHLHAYKEGVFDEGAVVCAPRFSDISLWTSRSENSEVGLQVPHAFLGSYFKQLPHGNWDFQLPEDPTAREAYRQPIGFVTTGFVRGSKRPSAVALCEAALLAHLRQEQWSQVPAKRRRKEIFVLVRNLRSTAYRLARASIILEEQEEDVLLI